MDQSVRWRTVSRIKRPALRTWCAPKRQMRNAACMQFERGVVVWPLEEIRLPAPLSHALGLCLTACGVRPRGGRWCGSAQRRTTGAGNIGPISVASVRGELARRVLHRSTVKELGMSTQPRRRHLSLPRLLLASFTLAGAGVVSSQPAMNASQTASPSVVPMSIHADSHGRSAWECARGFQRLAEACVAIKVPANAYLNTQGDGWHCDRGYLKSGERCTLVKVPNNAYLDGQTFGTGWECNRGYREANGACARILVPANAYAVDSPFGRGWECNRGYRRDGTGCAAVTVPANGFLQRAGDDWDCDRGFSKHANACVPVEVPANAYLDWKGNDWKCERGFRQRNSSCEALLVPANAYIGYSGNDWSCVEGFRKQGEACIPD